MDDDELAVLLKNERYPRSARYSARWMVDGVMGPNPLWQAEALTDVMPLEAGWVPPLWSGLFIAG